MDLNLSMSINSLSRQFQLNSTLDMASFERIASDEGAVSRVKSGKRIKSDATISLYVNVP